MNGNFLEAVWLVEATFDSSGFLTIRKGRLGVGGVVLVLVEDPSEGRRALMVRKARRAERPNYEFADQWCMPGGMIRQVKTGLVEAIQDGVRARACREAGLKTNDIEEMVPLPVYPPVSSYTVDGHRKYTVVLPFSGKLRSSAVVSPVGGDQSIAAVAWRRPVEAWRFMTPANRVILAAALWPQLSREEREAARPLAEAARQQCAGWAAEVDFDPVEPGTFD